MLRSGLVMTLRSLVSLYGIIVVVGSSCRSTCMAWRFAWRKTSRAVGIVPIAFRACSNLPRISVFVLKSLGRESCGFELAFKLVKGQLL